MTVTCYDVVVESAVLIQLIQQAVWVVEVSLFFDGSWNSRNLEKVALKFLVVVGFFYQQGYHLDGLDNQH